jgi:putative membrane protein
MWWGHHPVGWGGLILGACAMLLFWGSLLAIGWFLLRGWSRSRGDRGSSVSEGEPAAPAGPTALEILKERYARGEITQAEYKEMRADIEN